MGNPRFGWRESRTRKPHPCHWCPDEIPAGAVVPSWSARSGSFVVRRWAHAYCDGEALAEIAEALGDDEVPVEPDRGCIPRMLGFMDDLIDIHEYVTGDLSAGERTRLETMWERVHHGDLSELAGVRRG